MTMPAPDDDERDAKPLGSDAAPTDASDAGGGRDGGADENGSGVAGPSYPPEETEPDAH